MVALGVSAAGEELSTGVVTAAALGVAVVCAMWWLYFDIVAVAAERMLASLSGRMQAAMARDSYSYIHLFMVFGIVLVALGLKKTLLDIDAPLKSIVSVALFGGMALYLFAHIAFRLRNMGSINVQRLVTASRAARVDPGGRHASLTHVTRDPHGDPGRSGDVRDGPVPRGPSPHPVRRALTRPVG